MREKSPDLEQVGIFNKGSGNNPLPVSTEDKNSVRALRLGVLQQLGVDQAGDFDEALAAGSGA